LASPIRLVAKWKRFKTETDLPDARDPPERERTKRERPINNTLYKRQKQQRTSHRLNTQPTENKPHTEKEKEKKKKKKTIARIDNKATTDAEATNGDYNIKNKTKNLL
jgi:hypothetical protein